MSHDENAISENDLDRLLADAVRSNGIGMWHWFSIDQAIAATTLSRKCGELEANPHTPSQDEQARGLKWSEEDSRDNRSYATSSILSSVTFLEASINELFASANYPSFEVGGTLSADDRQRLTGVSDLIANNRFLDRFQITLHLLGREAFDEGAQHYQDAKILVNLRNELVHYKPQVRWTGVDAVESAKWVKALIGKRFAPNPFTGAGNPFFPDKCLGHGCTVWAWTAALTFADSFFARLGVKPIYDAHRDTLRP